MCTERVSLEFQRWCLFNGWVPRERFEGVLESQTVSRGFLLDIQMEQNIVWSWFRECMLMHMVSVAADLEVNRAISIHFLILNHPM